MARMAASAIVRLNSLSNGQRALLQLLSEERSREAGRIKAGQRTGGIGVPVSFAQQRMFFIDQLEEGSAGYQVPISLRLRGHLRVDALRAALDTVVQRHEVLRTVFVSAEGDARQEVVCADHLELKEIDITGYSEVEREAFVRFHKSEEVNGRFDLGIGPLIRGRLLTLGEEEYVLLITMHHIIVDGWSKGVLLRELALLYEAYCEGRANPLQPLAVQYADYAVWQRCHWGNQQFLEPQLAYWYECLKGAPPHLALPTDRARPATQTYRGENLPVNLESRLCSRLKGLAQSQGMTLFMILYAGWVILLSRLTGQDDIVIGTPIANRQRPELEGLIGLFVNALALRVGVDRKSKLQQFLEKIKEVTLGAYDHQDVPFEKIVEALQPQRTLNRGPLFQVMFVLHNWPKEELRLPGLAVSSEEEVDEPAILDIWVCLEERGDEIIGFVNYAADLFDRSTVRRWMACYVALLEAITDHAQRSVGELPILLNSERRQLIDSFNATRTLHQQKRRVHQLVEEQAQLAPDAAAIIYGGEIVTYAELNDRATRLARYLREHTKVGPDQLIALCVERSVEMVVGLLAIIKAGGAYVPIDPNYPVERLHFIISDAAPCVLITQEKWRCILPRTQAQVLTMEAITSSFASEIVRPSSIEVSGSDGDLVYVIYTSGSTGSPKGVTMTHRAMVNLIEWHRRCFGDDGGRVVLQFAALSFDVSFQEIFSTLCTGNALMLLDEVTRRDTQSLASFLRAHLIQRLFIPPMMLQSLAEYYCMNAGIVPPQNLLDVITAGEQLHVSHEIVSLFRRLHGCRLHNHYGPTETHVVTSLTLAGDPEDWPSRPVIGRPISNTQIYVLDRYQQLVPIGVAGEIFVGGMNVARGYLRRPALTSERFVLDPFGTEPQGRLYRTGDVGRWRADGTLEYWGRIDDQVKLHGFRIEPGEIEAQLVQHSQVKDAAVIVREGPPGERRLLAYVTTRDRSDLSPQELRTHLLSVLPEYMVPSAFVLLEDIPLTSNGKLDRSALPAPELQAYATRIYESPCGEIEQTVANIWQDLLGVAQVGRHDNFFELGGHSLLATRVMAHISAVLDVEIPLRALFERPTIESLSERIMQEIAAEVSMEAL